MVKYLRVANWEQFQHYKDRNPPWIKLHRDLLNDYKFACLQDDSKLHLMLIWLLASQMDNNIPADSDFIKRRINVSEEIDFKSLICNGFLIDDSNALARCEQSAMPETETETETETEDLLRAQAPAREEPALSVSKTEGEMCFSQICSAYPNKSRVDKGKSREEFYRGQHFPHAGKIIEAITIFSNTPEWKEQKGRYVPKLSNFLKNELYKNPPERKDNKYGF